MIIKKTKLEGIYLIELDKLNVDERGFFTLTMFSHAITYLIFWERIYFEPSKIWILPLDINFRDSISIPVVLYSGIVFLILFSVLCINKKHLSIKKV